MPATQNQHRSVKETKAKSGHTAKTGKQASAKPSPVIAQYLELKAVNPGYLMMYQLGDFFELFFEDAILASEKLGLTLTKRGTYQGKDIPMAGVPVRTINEYLAKAIRAGFKVAIIEQLEDPAEAKKRGSKAVVKRDVTRLVTPGTLTEDQLLEPGANNYLTAVFQTPGEATNEELRFALASLDISTGEFLTTETSARDLGGEISKINPSELIISENLTGAATIKSLLKNYEGAVSPVPHAHFSSLSGEADLKAILKTATLDAFGNFSRGELAAIGALLKYVELTQIGARPLIRPPDRSEETTAMGLDAATRTNLELMKSTSGAKKGSLFNALDRTLTAPGARTLAARLNAPLTKIELINDRLNALEFFITNSTLRDEMRQRLRAAPDITRALSRLSLGRGGPRDLGLIKDGLKAASDLLEGLESVNIDHLPKAIKKIRTELMFAETPLQSLLEKALIAENLPLEAREGDFIQQGYDDDLDEQRRLRDKSRQVIAALQTEYRELTGIKSLKVRHNNQFGYFVEVTSTTADKLLNNPMSETFRHRQTLANNTRFTTESLIEIEHKITLAADRALTLEKSIFDDLKAKTVTYQDKITALAHSLAELDVALALSLLSEQENYTRPLVDDSRTFEIDEGRHPVVEQALRKDKSGPFIENSCKLAKNNPDENANIWILTGPNMAGKSTFLRQNALIAIMAQMGCFVPAKKAHIGIIDRLFSRVGASDDLARGRSTFMVEMIETATILNQATHRSLVILDEIGRGTATFDGLSIAWATVEYLHDKICARALFATHYHELTCLREKLGNVTNATIEVREWNDEIIFLHNVVMGAADRSYGIQVAKLAGLPGTVITRAEEVLTCLEAESEREGAINQLEDLPLFSMESHEEPTAPAIEPPNPALQSLNEELLDLNPDDLTPKAALELIYKFKSIINN